MKTQRSIAAVKYLIDQWCKGRKEHAVEELWNYGEGIMELYSISSGNYEVSNEEKKMLAIVFQPSAGGRLEPPDDVTAAEVHDRYWKILCQTFSLEENSSNYFETLALCKLFPRDSYLWTRAWKDRDVNMMKEVGLVNENNFTIPSFGYYFAAKHLVEAIHKIQQLPEFTTFLLERIVSQTQESFIAELGPFMDFFLRRSTGDVCLEIENDKLEKLFVPYGAFEQAVVEDSGGFVRFFYFCAKKGMAKCVEDEMRKCLKTAFIGSHMKYAFKNERLVALDTLLDIAAAEGVRYQSILIDLLNKEDRTWIAKSHKVKFAEKLVSYVAECHPLMLIHSTAEKASLLEEAVDGRNEKLVQFIISFFIGKKWSDPIDLKNFTFSAVRMNSKKVSDILKYSASHGLAERLLYSTDESEETLLDYAVKWQLDKAVNAILTFATEFHIPTEILFSYKSGHHVLQSAIKNKHVKISEALVSHFRNNSCNATALLIPEYGGPPLIHLEVKNGNCKMVELLLNFAVEKGVDCSLLFARDEDGCSPLDLAWFARHRKIYQILFSFTLKHNIQVEERDSSPLPSIEAAEKSSGFLHSTAVNRPVVPRCRAKGNGLRKCYRGSCVRRGCGM